MLKGFLYSEVYMLYEKGIVKYIFIVMCYAFKLEGGSFNRLINLRFQTNFEMYGNLPFTKDDLPIEPIHVTFL